MPTPYGQAAAGRGGAWLVHALDGARVPGVALLRVGTVLVELEYQPVPDDSGWSREFEQLASTAAARAQQVQNA